MNSPSALAELDAYLALDFSDDYWSDEGVLQAHRLVGGLTASHWTSLETIWRNRDEIWQCRLASILPHGQTIAAIEILWAMSQSSDREVRISALDSIRELDFNLLEVDQRKRIEESARSLINDASRVESIILIDLLNKMKVPQP